MTRASQAATCHRDPAYYTVRYARRWFDTPVPEAVATSIESWAPPAPVRGLMDALVRRSIAGGTGAASPAAAFALYVRSHWLRMPPLRVVRHLFQKSVMARFSNEAR